MSKNHKRILERIRHKLNMALILGERGGSREPLGRETVNMLRVDSSEMANYLLPVYLAKNGAGAIWLAGKLREEYWLMDEQSASWARQKV